MIRILDGNKLTKQNILQIIDLDKQAHENKKYISSSEWNVGWYFNAFSKNKYSFFLALDENDEAVGYACVLPISKQDYHALENDCKIITDVNDYTSNLETYCYFNSLVVKPGYEDSNVSEELFQYVTKFVNKKLAKNHIYLNGIVANTHDNYLIDLLSEHGFEYKANMKCGNFINSILEK